MKTLNAVLKALTALATIAGIIYIVATYGEQIVAWAKKMLASLPKCPSCEEAEAAPEVAEEVTEAPAAEDAEAAPEAAAEEVAAEEPVEEPAPQVVVAENEPVAEDADFAE